MKQPIHYIIILWSIISGVLSACSTQEDFLGNDQPESQQIHIAYRVIDNEIQTRADIKDGEPSLNENKITRLDLFIASGSSLKHFYSTKTVVDATSEQTFTPDEETGTLPATVTAGTTFYLVANCPDVANISTLEDLKTHPISFDKEHPFNAKQETFVMDGLYTVTEAATKEITITIELSRALAKIRYALTGATLKEYKFINFATQTSVLAAEEKYDNNELQSMQEYVADSPLQDNEKHYVFYSYPNDWFDESLYILETDPEEKETYNKYVANNDGMHNTEPIIEERQPYLLIKADYKGTEGYYKIPVNYRLPTNSDQPGYTLTELEGIRDTYYRLLRNHLYDITVTIDGPGGPITDPVTPKYSIKINDWIQGNDYILDPDAFQ